MRGRRRAGGLDSGIPRSRPRFPRLAVPPRRFPTPRPCRLFPPRLVLPRLVLPLLLPPLLFPHPATPLAAQSPPPRPDAFLDPVARQLYTAAYQGWRALDETVVRYTARIDQRIAVAIRTPLRDRVLYHNESSVRAFWERDFESIVQVLGTRSEYPGRAIAMREGELDWLEDLPFDEPFEPGSDRLFLGMDDDNDVDAGPDRNEFNLIHPLALGADSLYRFQSGDTLALSFPDGRRLVAVELQVHPREAAARRIAGVLWIEPATGALVRATYRLSREFDAMRDVPELREEEEEGTFRTVPGFLKPWTFNLNVVAVDYALWEFRAWLPRSMRIEGEARAGVLRFPVSMDMAYGVESVVLEDDAAVAGERVDAVATDPARPAGDGGAGELTHIHHATRAEALAFIAGLLSEDDPVPYELMPEDETPARDRNALLIVPRDRSRVAESPHLPPPIWDDAPGFTAPEDLESYLRNLADLPAPPVQAIPWRFDWGWSGQDLLRYNRVEGPAVGGGLDWELGRRLELRTTGFFGLADLRPKARLELERSTVLRRLALGGYHELRSTDVRASHLATGNSLNALLFGRDNGEYFRATGFDLAWRPPAGRRESRLLRLYAERHQAAPSEIDFALFRVFDGDWSFRPNLAADPGDETGAELYLAPWWGSDPQHPQVGVEFDGRVAAWREDGGGDFAAYGQSSATVRAIVPVAGSGWEAWRLGFEAGAGTTWGDAPVQRSWFLGSAGTLRGYPASTLSGLSFARARLEVNRAWHGTGLSLFGDAGWAGARDNFRRDDLLYGIGVGGSVLDGLIRLDFARGLKGPLAGFRVELHLDAIL